MWILLASVFLLITIVTVFFRIPYSPTKAQFQKLTDVTRKEAANKVFAEADIGGLPLPVQRYFRYCGYLGTPKMSIMKASLSNVDFVMSKSRTIQIRYQQCNLVECPERYALISSSLFGIPFEGLDSYADGKGSMKGTLGKVIRLFDQRGEAMDRACLVTWLAECLMVPNAALQEFVIWEPVDDTHAKASICWKGISASGVFSFAETGELLGFRTRDRVAVDMDGNETQAEWSALFRKYHLANGLIQPEIIQSIWHYPQGDCTYFNQNEAPVTILYQ